MKLNRIKTILIIHTYGIGDMILFTPSLELLKQTYPEAKIDILITQPGSKLPVRHRSDINNIYEMKISVTDIFSNIFRLRRNKYDCSIVTSGGKPWKAMLFSLFIGAKVSVGEISSFLSFYTKPVKRDSSLHRKSSNGNLITTLIGHTSTLTTPTYTLPSELKEYGWDFKVKHNISDKVILGIHPGSNKEFAFRRWPMEFFCDIVNSLSEKFPNLAILLFIGPDEKKEGEFIKSHTSAIPVEEPSLDQVAAVVMSCDFFFNSDSGLGHIAACNPNCHIFSIFGPADENLTGPGNDNFTIIKKHLPCQPCNPENKKISFKCNLECLKELSPKEVLSEMLPILTAKMNS